MRFDAAKGWYFLLGILPYIKRRSRQLLQIRSGLDLLDDVSGD
jgi:hypothetical protein